MYTKADIRVQNFSLQVPQVSQATVLLPRFLFELHAVHDDAFSPALLRGKDGEVAAEHVADVRAEQLLLAGAHGVDEGADEAEVAAAVAAALVPGRVARGAARAEVGDGERAHVADELAVREVQARLALADELRVRDHRERGRRAVRELEAHDLKPRGRG